MLERQRVGHRPCVYRPPDGGSPEGPPRPRGVAPPHPAPRGGSRPPPGPMIGGSSFVPVPRARNLMCIGVGELAIGGQVAVSARSMATRWATISTASAFALKVLAQRAIWFRFAPIRASSRVRSRSTSACATVQVRARPTDRRTRSDSVNPAERAFACHSARSASRARIFTHTSRPALLMCRCRWGGQRGHSSPPAPAGDPRSVVSKGRRFPARLTNSSPDAGNPGPSISPYPYIEEPASCGVNNGKRGDIPRGPATYQRRTWLRQRTLSS